MKKRFIVILLLAIIIIPLGYAITFSINMLRLKHVMLEALEYKSLQVITTNVSSVIWVEEDEVIINGKYFDVKYHHISGNIIVLTGLYDDKEKELSQQIEKFYNTSNNTTTSRQIQALVLLLHPGILPENILSSATFLNKAESFALGSENIFLRKTAVDTPPPKFCC